MSKKILDEIQGNWEYEQCIKPEEVEWLIDIARQAIEGDSSAKETKTLGNL